MDPLIAAQFQTGLSIAASATIAAVLLGWAALVHFGMASGLRYGELVWSGSRIGRLPSEQRWWSGFYGLGLLGSAAVILHSASVVEFELILEEWTLAAGFIATSLLGVATVFALVKGSTFERMLLAPITLLGAGMAYWLAFIS